MDLMVYYPEASILHSLDARFKVGALVWLTLGLSGSHWQGLLLTTIGFLGLNALGRLPLRMYRSSLTALLLLGVFYTLTSSWSFTGMGSIVDGHWSLEGLKLAGILVWRIGLIFFLTRMFMAITPPLEQGMAIAYFFTPFLKLSPKVADFMLLLTMTLRFIPLLFEEGTLLWKARRLKGGWPSSWFLRIVEIAKLLSPLLLLSLRRAEQVAENLLTRGYASGSYRLISWGVWGKKESRGLFVIGLWTLLMIVF